MAAPTAPAPSAAAPSPQLPAYLAPVVDFVCDGDALAVVARGLSATVNVVAEVLRRCGGGDGRGVLVLNMNAREPELRDALRRLGGGGVAVAAASETSRAARAAVYGGGGVVLCGCRVAVVDLLDGTMDAARLGGVLIADAHRATERSLEAFVVRAFRERERPAEFPRAWVRGITEEPERLARGFGNLSKVVKELQVDGRVELESEISWTRLFDRASSTRREVHKSAESTSMRPSSINLTFGPAGRRRRPVAALRARPRERARAQPAARLRAAARARRARGGVPAGRRRRRRRVRPRAPGRERVIRRRFNVSVSRETIHVS